MKTRTIQFADGLEMTVDQNFKVITSNKEPAYHNVLVRDVQVGYLPVFILPDDSHYTYPFPVTHVIEN